VLYEERCYSDFTPAGEEFVYEAPTASAKTGRADLSYNRSLDTGGFRRLLRTED